MTHVAIDDLCKHELLDEKAMRRVQGGLTPNMPCQWPEKWPEKQYPDLEKIVAEYFKKLPIPTPVKESGDPYAPGGPLGGPF